jgi:hypothetical protein
VVFVIAMANAISFSVATSHFGGTTMAGKIESGKHYVGNHGRYTEVSSDVYERLHTWNIVTFMLIAFVFPCALVFITSHRSSSADSRDVA